MLATHHGTSLAGLDPTRPAYPAAASWACVKRDGTEVPFQPGKLTRAVLGCFRDVAGRPADTPEAMVAHAAEIAWFAPVVASHTVYFVSNSVKSPRIGQSVVIDAIDFLPAK